MDARLLYAPIQMVIINPVICMYILLLILCGKKPYKKPISSNVTVNVLLEPKFVLQSFP